MTVVLPPLGRGLGAVHRRHASQTSAKRDQQQPTHFLGSVSQKLRRGDTSVQSACESGEGCFVFASASSANLSWGLGGRGPIQWFNSTMNTMGKV